jgi:nitrite reductase/ring-hydroxylating ferredoxin subunit
MTTHRSLRRVRIPGSARLRDGEAKKVLVPSERAGEPPREVVLVRRDGRLFALDSLCPHEGGRIGEGPLWEGRYVACPLHLYRFDPATGAAIDVECAPATTYGVRELNGTVEIELPRDDEDEQGREHG